MPDDRITELEIHVAHLESAQEELGNLLIRQQATLEALADKVETLLRRLELGTGLPNGTADG